MLRDTCPDLGASDDLWRVRLAAGDRTMTLDELDLAFEAGAINAETMVCAPGSLAFARLGAAAGLDEPAPPPASDTDVGIDVLMDFDVPDLEGQGIPFRPRWTRRLLAIPAALVLLAVIAIGASASASNEPVSVTRAPPSVSAPSPPSAVAPAQPVVSPPGPAPLTEDQKKALAAKDKKADPRKRKTPAVAPPRRFAASKSAPFGKGGSKHDPLNGSL